MDNAPKMFVVRYHNSPLAIFPLNKYEYAWISTPKHKIDMRKFPPQHKGGWKYRVIFFRKMDYETIYETFEFHTDVSAIKIIEDFIAAKEASIEQS